MRAILAVMILAMCAVCFGQKGVAVEPVALKAVTVSIDTAKTVLMTQKLVPIKQPVYEMKTLTAKDSAGNDYQYQGLAQKVVGGVPVYKDTTVYKQERIAAYPDYEFAAGKVMTLIMMDGETVVYSCKKVIPAMETGKAMRFTIAVDAGAQIKAKK